MAAKDRTIPLQAPVLSPLSPIGLEARRAQAANPASAVEQFVSKFATETTELLLLHAASDAVWCQNLAGRLRSERYSGWQPTIVFANGDFLSGSGHPCAPSGQFPYRFARFLGFVISSAMLHEKAAELETIISNLSKLEAEGTRIVSLLAENVTLPAPLRLRDWFDFRDALRSERSAAELAALLREEPQPSDGRGRATAASLATPAARPAWKAKPLFARPRSTRERIVTNLFPVVETPREFFSFESRFRSEGEVAAASNGPGPIPFVLRGATLYGVAPNAANSGLAAGANGAGSDPKRELFAEWLRDPDRAPVAIELLNRLLRYHAWKRGLRFDEGHDLFYFTRSKPKTLWWEMAGKTMQRQVTAAHIQSNFVEGYGAAEFQCGWKHEAIRAGFVQAFGSLFLRLDPAWFLTELDGKTPATAQPVVVRGTQQAQPGRNGLILQALRFWSTVLSKGHRELRIETGANPLRVRLTPAAGYSPCLLSNDQMGFDAVALAGIDDVQLIPDLGPAENPVED